MPAKTKRIPELDGYRALLIFLVSWYHIWQQSWWTPHVGDTSLDFLVRSGYIWVDGTILLSGFLLYLPWARAGRNSLPDTRAFYRRRAERVLPSYLFILLAVLLGIVLPWGLYSSPQYMVKDLVTHLTFTFNFFGDTYVSTPLGAACWTLAVEVQFYLLFPLLARGVKRCPQVVLPAMAAVSWAFRAWCLWSLSDYSLVVNQCLNFLDVYAVGMAAAMIYVRLERLDLSGRRGLIIRSCATVLLAVLAVLAVRLVRSQAGCSGYPAIQQGQMLRRFPFALLMAGIILCLPMALKPVRLLTGNPVTKFLGGISMNYYLIHQTLAVHLKRLGIPYSASDVPNQTGEMPWQMQYTWLCFGLSLLLAALVTYGVEKPGGRLMRRLFDRWDRHQASRREKAGEKQPEIPGAEKTEMKKVESYGEEPIVETEQTRSIVDAIVADYGKGRTIDKLDLSNRPDKEAVIEIINKLMSILYAGYYRDRTVKLYDARTGLAVAVEDCMYRLQREIAAVLPYGEKYAGQSMETLQEEAHAITCEFFRRIPEIRDRMELDLQAFLDADPAASNKDEIVYAYPGFFTISVHRLAHELWKLDVPMLPRVMSEHAHSVTGIDIHPGATIGRWFFIDHGTGIVIGETTEIGDHVKIYQGVTLGALSTSGGQALHGVKRHPTVEDRVTVYANASVLGATRIGHDSVIGGNVFITEDVPAGTRVSNKPQEKDFRVKGSREKKD